MNLIHIVSNSLPINMGIWNASLMGNQALLDLGVTSYFWTCEEDAQNPNPDFKLLDLKETSPMAFIKGLEEYFDKKSTIIITHGCWLNPTRIGFYGAKAGFNWIYIPHGMLEPWSLRQNLLFKSLYFQFFEKRYIKKAKGIRAVSIVEKDSLKKKLKREVFFIPNGVPAGEFIPKSSDSSIFLFLSRLHHKKGILPLVAAWNKIMANNQKALLIIAGPDEGELEKIKPFLGKNLEYRGAVYKEEKLKLLKEANYFILPSFSEGFPTSVLEAMSLGVIPLISKGCNFPEVFDNNLGYAVEPDETELLKILNFLGNKDFDHEKSARNVDWINNNYTEEILAKKLLREYAKTLGDVQ